MSTARASAPLQMIQAKTPEHVEAARLLFREYEAHIGVDLCFQNFARELANLPGDYAPPQGRLLLAYWEGELAGCVALRQLDDAACEMKRLFARPALHGKGVGRALAEAAIAEARAIGYARMRLDTLPVMQKAQQLYTALGFYDIAPYRANPVPGARYMELTL